MIDDKEFIKKAIIELLSPQFLVTKQYLEACELEYENGLPKIARIKRGYYEDGSGAAVFFYVKNECYFIEVILVSKPEVLVNWVSTQSANQVYFRSASLKLSFNELSAHTQLKPLEGWSIGERIEFKNSKNDFSVITYEPIKNRAYELEEKLNLLLDDLETDSNGIIELSTHPDIFTQISVCRELYISGNKGIHFDIKTINRLSKLNLGIDIDAYVYGNALKY